MKKLFTLIFLAFFSHLLSAQNINNYVFATNTNASLLRSNGSLVDDINMSSGASILLGGSQATANSASTQLGFDFWYYGQRLSTFNVTANGYVGLGTFVGSTTAWLSNLFSGARLAPFLAPVYSTNPQFSGMGTSSIGRVHYKVIGTAPTRIAVIEFLRMAVNSSVIDDTTTFQVRLYENTGAIEYVYGRMKVEAGAPISFTVGMQAPTNNFQSVDIGNNTSSSVNNTSNVVANNGFITNLHSWTPGNQRVYRWQPTPPGTPTNLTFTNITANSITLNWNDVSNEIGYAIYRSVDGGQTFTWSNNVGANATSSVQTGLPANTTVYFRVYAYRESLSDALDGNANTAPANIVTSVQSGNWGSATTWSTNSVPTIQDSVLIDNGHTVVLDNTACTAKHLEINGTLQYSNTTNAVLNMYGNIKINNTGSFTAGTGTATNHNLYLGNNATSVLSAGITNDGVFDMFTTASVNTYFYGTLDASVNGTGTTEFSTIFIQKGNSTNILLNGTVEINAVINIAPPTTTATRLNITAGTLKISSASVLTPYPANANYVIVNNNGRLWLNHPGASLSPLATTNTNNYFWYVYGHLIIDEGTLTVGGGNHQNFTTTTTNITINGGTWNINGQLNLNNFPSCSLTVNGGNINFNPQIGSVRLLNAASIFLLQTGSYFNFTGGNINIINPSAFSNNNAIEIQSSSNKFITGGNFVLGNGTSGLASANPANTAGFGISSAAPLYNLIINNRKDLSATRQVILKRDLVVANNLVVEPNAYLFLGSANAGYKLSVGGNVINNGEIAGTEVNGTQLLGNLTLNGQNSLQTISGSGQLVRLYELSAANSGGSVTLSNSNAWSTVKVSLLSGLFNTGGNFTIGSSLGSPIIQVGGIDESTPAGAFLSLPAVNNIAGNTSYIYGPSSSNMVTGGFLEMPTGNITVKKLMINDLDGLQANRSITLDDSLVLNSGNLRMGASNLTLGTSATNPGRLQRNNNFVEFTTGAFTRWYNAGSNLTNDYNLGFPVSVSGMDRSLLISSNGTNLGNGGSISYMHNNVSGAFDLVTPYTDGGVLVNRRSFSGYMFNVNGITNAGGIIFTAAGQGLGNVTNVANLRMVRSLDANAGSNINGSGTNTQPMFSRLFNNAQLAANAANDTFYLGVNSSENPLAPTFTAVANGDWQSPSTWDGSQVPTSSNGVVIPAPFNVTLNTGSNLGCDTIYIAAGASLTLSTSNFSVAKGIYQEGNLTINGGSVNILGSKQNGLFTGSNGVFTGTAGSLTLGQAGGGDRSWNINGVFNLPGANLTINGNINFNSGSTFNQSGGNLFVDGNSGTASSSVPQGTHLVNISASTINCSSGSIQIIDPPHNSYSAGSTQSLRITSGSSLTAFTGSHTVILGNGFSTETGNINGFNIDNRRSGIVPLQNVIVNAGNANGRWLSPSYSTGSFGLYIKGDLTIMSGSEVRHTTPSQLVIGGNIFNSGTFTSSQTVTLGGLGYVVNTPQQYNGIGVVRNNTTSPTANFANLTIDNSGGLTIASLAAVISFSGNLNLVNGILNAGNNTIRIISGANINRTNGFIQGSVSRFVNSGSNVNITYPVGYFNSYAPATFSIPSISTAGELTFSSIATDHPQIANSCINDSKSVNRYWTLTNNGIVGLSNYTATIEFASADIDAGANALNFSAQLFSSNAWSGSTIINRANNQITVSGIASAGDIAVGEFNTNNASVSISTATNNICFGSNITFTANAVNGGLNPSYQWKKNGNNVGTNSNTYSDNGLFNGDIITCEMTSSAACVSGAVNSNAITMQVSSPTIRGTVTANQSICSGSSPNALNLSGNNGSVVRWEQSVSPFTNWNIITNTNSSYSPGVLNQTTAFRAVVQNGGCATANADSAIVTVIAAPVAGNAIGSATICAGGGAAPINLTGSSGGSVIRWESSVSPFFVWTPINNTTTTLNPGIITQTTQFRAVVSNGLCSEVVSSPATVTVQQPGQWLGNINSSWTNAGNWCGGVPTATTDVYINAGTPFTPQIDGNVSCKDLIIFNLASLQFAGSGNTLNLFGDAYINGTLNTANGTVNMAGSNYQQIPPVNYNNLIISGGGVKELAQTTIVNGTLTLTNGYLLISNSNLIIGGNGNIAGAGATSFIVTDAGGKLIQQNIGSTGRTGNILFPLGINTTDYSPIVLNNTGTADDFNASVFNGVYLNYIGETPQGFNVLNDVVSKTYFVNEATAGGSNVSLTFQWNASAEQSGFNRSSCFVTTYNGSAWVPFSSGAASGANPYTRSVTGVTSLGIFGVGSAGTLPVKLLSFTGTLETKQIKLNWITASEENSSHFIVERSYNGTDFEEIGLVKAAFNSKVKLNYAFTDVNVEPKVTFYRLNMVDADGSNEYSNIIMVDPKLTSGAEIVTSPNPFTETITISNLNGNSNLVTLTDASGRILVQTESFTQEKLVLNNLTYLPAGMYFITITQNGVNTVKKLIKQ